MVYYILSVPGYRAEVKEYLEKLGLRKSYVGIDFGDITRVVDRYTVRIQNI